MIADNDVQIWTNGKDTLHLVPVNHFDAYFKLKPNDKTLWAPGITAFWLLSNGYCRV